MPFQVTRSSILALTVVSAGALPWAGSAIADSPGYCNEYANQAVISASQNATFHCGFTGSRWSFNYQEHYGWCVTASHSQTVSERLIRKNGIVSCHGGTTHNGG